MFRYIAPLAILLQAACHSVTSKALDSHNSILQTTSVLVQSIEGCNAVRCGGNSDRWKVFGRKPKIQSGVMKDKLDLIERADLDWDWDK